MIKPRRGKTQSKKTVVVAVHDAGGAEIIAAFVRKHRKRTRFSVYAGGPALAVFKREKLFFKRAPRTRKGMARILKNSKNIAYALIGTGWMTMVEINACIEAKRAGIKAYMYLDSWMNYRGRFGYPNHGWQKRLPDEFWVGDPFALVLARKAFSQIRVRMVPNQYFVNVKKRYQALSKKHAPRNAILFLSTPGAEARNILAELLKHVSLMEKPPIMRIRFHPADSRKRYDALAERYRRDMRIEVSQEKDIVEDIVRARVAIGAETMALAVTALVGVKAICVAPPREKPLLPFPKMVRATGMKAALRMLNLS
ncbi:hypothetical protein A3F27_02260 [Candidatus Kaiserbacteria bacterium RIFCSPHIGHO2_12_FULL_53_13]|uniref:Lipid-A-disaccharide synthase n=1 Tax=Candidatus Kaiserbacteria bacterium RIFCSPHIGHO2_12_FULL_53_13 TaxID=1798502 RepID=A0A1F6ED63_9BACT|nr:MAG: hypothetical protein A3F27_02260 [Candidatus Kaiserbacteria bacterium RIFCSPHIGHO2_12_FULL_53_13]OGG74691.1 MAG: hypothetical protein A3A37_02390 [Candidatus Kaiserbacteria bacterium RIFCSPLOWO2_01_FULL_52_36]